MFVAFIGILGIVSGYILSDTNLMALGFGTIFFDVVIELTNIKNMLHAIGITFRKELEEIREKM